MRVIKVKNLQAVSDTYEGKPIGAGEYYTIQSEAERHKFATSPKVNQHLWDSTPKIAISDGGKDLSQEEGDRWLKKIEKQDLDGRGITHCTPRYLGTYTYFTSEDDDQADPHAVGGGSNILKWDHSISGNNPEVVYMDFNTIYNKTYVRQGDLIWKDAVFDTLTFKMVPKTTAYTSGSNTNYNLYGGYLIIPAAGDGTIAINDADRLLVQNVPNEFGNLPAGYWDADWDSTNKEFINITPNPYGTGEYNMFGLEVVLHQFMNKRTLLGTGRKDCMTEDVAQLGHGIRIKIEAATAGADHAWSGCGNLMMYRQKTC